ncbi:MAG: hypothetical protein KQA34_03300 [Candidatus Aenigmarchaeota archaeon]|nr:hypothetical protein [Candidatus Aenigmarchaeota archaeon]
MKQKFKLFSTSLTPLLMIIIIISLLGFISFFIFSLTPKVVLTSFYKPIIDCKEGIVRVLIEYSGKTNLTKNEIKVFLNGKFLREDFYNFVGYENYFEIILPLAFLTEKEINELLVSSYGKGIRISLRNECGNLESFFIPLEFRNLSLVAYSSPHWIVIDYVLGKYLIYRSTNGDLIAEQGPYEGDIPIYTGLYNFTIQTSQSSWDNRPIDSPIIIFKNPNPNDIWIFNWTDPHGTFRFRMYPIENALDDMLIFWEDLFNPFSPPSSLDDWKDHVVRVTILPNNTYRIAVHLAKGGYKHGFYAFTSSSNPLEGMLVYEKPYGQTFSNYNQGFYDEFRSWTVRLSS